MNIHFETERLIIRPLVPEDAEAAFRWCGDPDVNTYMIYPLYHRVEDVRTWLESRDTDDPDNFDEGIVLKSTGELIGSGGMRYHPERNAWEIGYNIRKDQWGNGYVVEYLTALMDQIRKVRPVEAIDGIFAAENYKSRRVMSWRNWAWSTSGIPALTGWTGARRFRRSITGGTFPSLLTSAWYAGGSKRPGRGRTRISSGNWRRDMW